MDDLVLKLIVTATLIILLELKEFGLFNCQYGPRVRFLGTEGDFGPGHV